MPKKQITHYAYDYGVLDFTTLNQPKSKTTLCNKRVSPGKIDNRYPTCPDCRAIHQEAEALRATLQEENPSLLYDHEHI